VGGGGDLRAFVGFDLEDLPFANDSNLPLHADPKQAWAQMYLIDKPIEINKAEKRNYTANGATKVGR